MKGLLVFTENYLRGGGNRYLVDVINAVAQQFDEVALVSNPGGLFSDDLERLRVPVTRADIGICTIARIEQALAAVPPGARKTMLLFVMPLEPLFFVWNLLLSIRLLQKLRPDTVLCCNGGYPGGRSLLAMTIAAHFLKIPTYLSIVSMPMHYKKYLGFYERCIDRKVWKSAVRVIVNADSIARALQSMRGMPAGKAEIVHNGIDQKPFHARVSIEGEELVIGCVARMDRAKGVLFLLEAFARLACTDRRLRLVLVGSGDASGALRERVRQLELSEQVTLTGYHDGSIDRLLASFHLYLFPSLHEGFPYSILEAMRAGCAIITTDVGGIPEAVSDGIEGLLVRPASVDALEQAMQKLLADGELCGRLGARARERFSRDFTLEKMQLRLRQIFTGGAGA